MILLLYRLLCLLLPLMVGSAAAVADEAEIWSESITPSWLDDHVVARRATNLHPSAQLNRTQVWANDIARSDMQAFAPTVPDRTVGAKVQLFHDYNFMVGTELVGGSNEAGFLSSKVSWEAFLTRDWERLGGVKLGLSTAGFVDSVQRGYSQSISGSMGIPLDLSLRTWSTELRLSPSMSLGAVRGTIGTSLMSEMIGQTRLTSPADRLRSELNVRVGYGFAPNSQPVASAKLELRISPNF